MNIKSNPEWDEKPAYEKRLSVFGMVLAVIILLMAVLQMGGIVKNLTVVFVPLMGLLMLVQAMQMWRNRRVVAVICIVVAIFLFLCSILFVLAL